MKKLKTAVAVLLCFVFILPLLVSCGEKDEPKKDEITTVSGENPGDDSKDENDSSDNKPDEKDPNEPNFPGIDMNGKIFTILSLGTDGDPNITDIVTEELNADPVNDAAYNRLMKVENMYNIKLKQVNAGDNEETLNAYRTSILANDGAYDVAITRCGNFTSLLSGNYLVDFKDLTYLDVDKPYWNKNFYDSMALIGKNYAMDGDVSKRRLECVWIMAFNKDLIQINDFESPYDLVKDGRWTYDKMHEMARSAAKDVNGDGVMDFDADLWGINYTGDTIMGIINCSGVKFAEINSKGVPEFTINTEANLEKLLRIYTDMRDHTYSIDTLFQVGGGVTGLGDVDVFADNRCLFLACATHNISYNENTNNTQSLRTMEVNLGIIPYPKWDLAQADYLPHTAGGYYPVMTIPQTNYDLENTAIILETLAYEGMKNISPVF